ncbi:MAG: hypothetical protein RR161_01585 [Bacilli bacterium]
MKKNLINLVITIIIGLVMYYFYLPAFNINNIGFWFYIITLMFVYIILTYSTNIDFLTGRIKEKSKVGGVLARVLPLIFLGIILVNFILSPMFNASSYAKRIKIDESKKFTEDIKQVDFKTLPLLDKDSSRKLGDRVMGGMPELVSQFAVSDLYTQISYNKEISRVTPLEYADFFKWLSNKKDGVMGYITVSSVTGKAELEKLKKGMKYMPSAYFSKDLNRHLRLKYMFTNFGEKTFELDDSGKPYWVIPTIEYKGIGLKRDASGVITVDPVTGDTKRYEKGKVPSWIDHVYAADMIIEQVDNWGMYKGGFINSIFGQKNVTMTTRGYNYLVIDEDVYLYTGITSVAADEANLGFILANLRTKETKFYKVPGAEEYSAMGSAEGQVQQMKYNASFPLLINLNDKATYLISLKDNAGLVKMYAFVDVEDYQKVVVSDASKGIEQAALNYLNGEGLDVDNKDLKTENITVSSINNVTIDGNTYYFVKDTNNLKYRISIKVDKNYLPFLKIGDTIKIAYKVKSDITEVIKINE